MTKMKNAVIAMIIFSCTSAMANDTLKEIKDRCKSQMGAHGANIVKACIDLDLRVLSEINSYAKTHKSTHNRCMRDMRSHGFNIVHACIKMDVDAQRAIDNY